jgi:hypothetical protein
VVLRTHDRCEFDDGPRRLWLSYNKIGSDLSLGPRRHAPAGYCIICDVRMPDDASSRGRCGFDGGRVGTYIVQSAPARQRCAS